MSDSVTVSVEVAVPPDVAFEVFTRDIDAWYRVDADTLPDVTRTAAIRFEPSVGGRLLDVHDLATGEGRELGRVTAWEPGQRLAFTDNEHTLIEVTFIGTRAGTRVTLTHRGLERLPASRAAQLRRSGWAALAALYRDHLAPNARPLALDAAILMVFLATTTALWLVLRPERDQPSLWIFVPLNMWLGVGISVVVYRRARRWLPSRWRFHLIFSRTTAAVALGLLIFSLIERNFAALPLVVLMLLIWWRSEQLGPSLGQSMVDRSPRRLIQRYPVATLFCALTVGSLLGYGLYSIDPKLVFAVAFAGPVLALHQLVSVRRQRKNLGFNPNFFVSVDRGVSDRAQRPSLLVHRPSDDPEYSGWSAYAVGSDKDSDDPVTWSMKDLIDHAPEAVRPLREGKGTWIWDDQQQAYRPLAAPRAGG